VHLANAHLIKVLTVNP